MTYQMESIKRKQTFDGGLMNKTRSEKVIIIGHFTFHKPPSHTERQLEAGRAQVVGATRTGREAGRETDHMRAHTSLTGKC